MDDDSKRQKRLDKAVQNWVNWASLVPEYAHAYGFCSFYDAHPNLGGGMDILAWLSDRNSMLEFIAATLP
jgi:hypothetical protein